MTKHFELEDEVLVKGVVKETVTVDQKQEPESYFIKIGYQMLLFSPEVLSSAKYCERLKNEVSHFLFWLDSGGDKQDIAAIEHLTAAFEDRPVDRELTGADYVPDSE